MVRLQLDERQWQKVKAALGVRRRAGRPGRDLASRLRQRRLRGQLPAARYQP